MYIMYVDLFVIKGGPKGLNSCQDSSQGSTYWLLMTEAQRLGRPAGVHWIFHSVGLPAF